MKNHLKQLGKHTFIFGFGDCLRGIVGFMLIPVYTRYLTPTDYGQLELLSITLSIMFIIFSQGMGTAFCRTYVFAEKELRKSTNDLISTAYFYMILCALFSSILLYTFSEECSVFLFGKNNSTEIFVKIIAFTGFFNLIMFIPFQLFRAKMESVKYIAVSLIQFFFQVILNIYFVVVLKLELKGILLGNAISGFFIVIITFLLISRYLNFKISIIILKDLLRFGLPLMLAAISIWFLQLSDRFLLQKLSTTHELGLYSLGSRFAGILALVIIGPFQRVWGAFSFQIAVKEQAKETFKITTTYVFLILCFFAANVIVFAPLLIKFIADEQFWDAYKVILPLVYTNIGVGMTFIFGFGLQLLKKTKYIAFIYGTGAIVNITLNLFVIPKYGMIGAAFTSLFAYVIINCLLYHLSQRSYYIPFDKLRLLKIASIFLIITISSSIFQFSNFTIDILYRILLVVLFCGSFLIIRFFEHEEIIYIKQVYCYFREQKGISNKLKYAYNLINS